MYLLAYESSSVTLSAAAGAFIRCHPEKLEQPIYLTLPVRQTVKSFCDLIYGVIPSHLCTGYTSNLSICNLSNLLHKPILCAPRKTEIIWAISHWVSRGNNKVIPLPFIASPRISSDAPFA